MEQKYFINAKIPYPKVFMGEEKDLPVIKRTTIETLCKNARISYRIIGGNPPEILLHKTGRGHLKIVRDYGEIACAVDISSIKRLKDPEFSVRILEIVSYGFMDYYSRECTRGIFTGKISEANNRQETEIKYGR